MSAQATTEGSSSRDVYSRLLSNFRSAKLKASSSSSTTSDSMGEGGSAAPGGGGESVVLFVGDPEAGRTSLISAFLNPNKEGGDKTKPTVALEYMFARRSSSSSSAAGGNNNNKDIAHLWDLGGGSQLSELVRVPFKAESLARTAVVLVLDLSQPQNVMCGLLYWLRLLRSLTSERLEELRQQTTGGGAEAAEALQAAAKARYAKDHMDRRAVSPLAVPVLIVGNKYDQFKDLDGVKRKLVAQGLRFVAHQHGASLVFTSTREKALRDQYRHLASHLLFRTPLKRLHETNGEKPVVVLAGMDSFQDIVAKGVGPPGVEAQDLLSPSLAATSDQALDAWKAHFHKFFGPPAPEAAAPSGRGGKGGEQEAKDAEADGLAPEAQVDEARKARDEALERYRKEAERRQQLASMERRQQQQQTSTAAPSTAGSSVDSTAAGLSQVSSSSAAAPKPSVKRSASSKGLDSKKERTTAGAKS